MQNFVLLSGNSPVKFTILKMNFAGELSRWWAFITEVLSNKSKLSLFWERTNCRINNSTRKEHAPIFNCFKVVDILAISCEKHLLKLFP